MILTEFLTANLKQKTLAKQFKILTLNYLEGLCVAAHGAAVLSCPRRAGKEFAEGQAQVVQDFQNVLFFRIVRFQFSQLVLVT